MTQYKHIFLCIVLAVLTGLSANAQRWSVNGQTGASMGNGGQMPESIAAPEAMAVSRLDGGGVTFGFNHNWRVSLGYSYSKILREQRFSSLQADGLAYRKISMRHHDIDLIAEYDFLGGLSGRWGLLIGTGVGEMIARGPDYTIAMGSSVKDVNGDQTRFDFDAWVKSGSKHLSANSVYVPLTLTTEFAVASNVALGLRLKGCWLAQKNDNLPAFTESAAAIIRFSFGK